MKNRILSTVAALVEVASNPTEDRRYRLRNTVLHAGATVYYLYDPKDRSSRNDISVSGELAQQVATAWDRDQFGQFRGSLTLAQLAKRLGTDVKKARAARAAHDAQVLAERKAANHRRNVAKQMQDLLDQMDESPVTLASGEEVGQTLRAALVRTLNQLTSDDARAAEACAYTGLYQTPRNG